VSLYLSEDEGLRGRLVWFVDDVLVAFDLACIVDRDALTLNASPSIASQQVGLAS
jgi:hypothetical protein